MKISFFVHDLSSNPIVRAAPLAKALEKAGHSVEILGLLPDGKEINKSYREAFCFKTITCDGGIGKFLRHVWQLSRLAEGDVFYACKPLPTTLWPAMLARKRRGGRLLLDVEDEHARFFNTYKNKVKQLLRFCRDPMKAKYHFVSRCLVKRSRWGDSFK